MEKAINFANIILGTTFLILSGSFLVKVLPRLQTVYNDFQGVAPNFLFPKVILITILAISIVGIIFGIVGLVKENKLIKKLNLITIALLVVVFFAFPLLTFTTISPIYNLANNLQ